MEKGLILGFSGASILILGCVIIIMHLTALKDVCLEAHIKKIELESCANISGY